MPNDPVSVQDVRRGLEIRLATSLDVSIRHEVGRQKFWLSDAEMGLLLDALRSDPARVADDEPTPEMIAAAWAAWRVRHPTLSIGPGPAFREAIVAALKARR